MKRKPVISIYTGTLASRKADAHVLFKFQGLIHFPWEAVNQEPTTIFSPTFSAASFGQSVLHRVLEKLDCYFHGYDCAFFDVCPNEISTLRTFTVLLRT